MGSKRVFITGGASGLGRALANRFADAGYSVCIGDVDDGRGAEALAELKAKGQAHYVNCDVTKSGKVSLKIDITFYLFIY